MTTVVITGASTGIGLACVKASLAKGHKVIATARKNVSQNVWNYITGAAETETTLRRNRHALDCLALRPRILRDVSEIDASTSFLGHKLRIPALVAPIERPTR